MDTLLQDLRFAVRGLFRSRLFAGAALAALALGIGANTAIFALVDRLLIRPLPFEEAERLVVVWDENVRTGARWNEVAPGNFRALAERAHSFESLAAYDIAGLRLERDGAEPEELRGLLVQPAFFDVLKARPALGRTFQPGEDVAGASNVAVIGHALWQRLGARPDIVGSTLQLGGRPVTVVGVMSEEFFFASPAELWLPFVASEEWWSNFGRHTLRVVGRLAPGSTIGAARAEALVISTELEQAQPQTNAGWRLSVYNAAEGTFQGPVARMLQLLWGAVGFVLLIICADVANLLLARAAGRNREMAVRAALGASRGRLLRLLLTESALLACAGGALGLLLATWLLDLCLALLPAEVTTFDPRIASIGVDVRVMTYGLGAAFATALIFGIAPALRAASGDLKSRLMDGARAGGGGPGTHRARFTLVAAQFALALLLLAGAATFMAGLLAQMRANPNLNRNLVAAWLRLPDDVEDSRLAISLLRERLALEPVIQEAAVTFAYPLSGEGFRPAFEVPGRPAAPDAERPWTHVRLVSENYLPLIGVPLLHGRALQATDREGAVSVAVVSAAFATRFFAGEDPLGQRIVIDGDEGPRTIVGVVGDITDWRTGTSSDAYVYAPVMQWAPQGFAVMLRSAGNRTQAVAALRRAAQDVDPRMTPVRPVSMGEVLDESVSAQRFAATLLGVFALLALILAGIGVFGVMAYVVGLRVHEMGVRMALGARPADVRRHVVVLGLRPVLAGIAIGLLLALTARRILDSIVVGAGSTRATAPFIAAGVLALIAVLALWIPARRATRADPVAALRQS
jgi:predicted permease